MAALCVLLPLIVLATASGFGQVPTLIEHFPGRPDLAIGVRSLPPNPQENSSQIFIFQADKSGHKQLLWQSELESGYAPQVDFAPEINSEGLPVALVQLQFGAAYGELELIGQSAGRFTRLQRLVGSYFEVTPLEGGSSFIIAHEKPYVLDIPLIYRWNENRLVNVSSAHPGYYRELLRTHEAEPYQEWAGVMLLDLSHIAALAGEHAKEQALLKLAYQNESKQGTAANRDVLREASRRLRAIPSNAMN
jgi:hypothetical protein